MTTAATEERKTKECETCGREIWLDTEWPAIPYPYRNADDDSLHDCPPEMPTLEWLQEMHDGLERLEALVDNDKAVPDRYKDTTRGLLAEADAAALSRAARVVHRLTLWAKHPQVSPETYFGIETPDA
jgi:hypothetical protein